MFEDDTSRIYDVVRNAEDQHSVWPSDRPLPPGWTKVGVSGVKRECLARIKALWTDQSPKSLQQQTRE